MGAMFPCFTPAGNIETTIDFDKLYMVVSRIMAPKMFMS